MFLNFILRPSNLLLGYCNVFSSGEDVKPRQMEKKPGKTFAFFIVEMCRRKFGGDCPRIFRGDVPSDTWGKGALELVGE